MKRAGVWAPWVIVIVALLMMGAVLLLGRWSSRGAEVVGLVILTILIASTFAVMMSMRAARRLEREVDVKTEELRESNERLRATLDHLKAAHEFLQSIIDGVAEPIMVVGADYRVRLINKAAREFSLGSSPGSEPLFCYQVSHQHQAPCKGAAEPCPMEQVRESGQPLTVLHRHHHADGEPRFVEVIASPLWGADGHFQGIIEAVRDVTGRTATEDLLALETEEMAPDELEKFSSQVIESIQAFFAKLPPES